MGSCAAVGVHDNFAPGQAAVALRATDNKFACGVNQVFGFGREQFFGQHGQDNVFFHGLAQLFVADFGRVLGGKDYGVNAGYFARFAVVGHG